MLQYYSMDGLVIETCQNCAFLAKLFKILMLYQQAMAAAKQQQQQQQQQQQHLRRDSQLHRMSSISQYIERRPSDPNCLQQAGSPTFESPGNTRMV